MPLIEPKLEGPRARRLLAVAILSGVSVWAGCSAADSATPSYAVPAPRTAAQNLIDGWFAIFVGKTKVGYERTVTTSIIERGKTLRQIDDEVDLLVSRNCQPTEEKIVSDDIETPAGQLLRFRTEINVGSQPVVASGENRNGEMRFTTGSSGAATQNSIPWPAGVGGFKASEQSLAARPMQPGEHRRLKEFTAGFNEIADVEMVAEVYEPTQLLDRSANLLRIRWTAKFPKGPAIEGTFWTDTEGQLMKVELAALHQTAIRTTQSIATSASAAPRFDLLLSTAVPVDRPLPNVSEAYQVRYRVHLDFGDPSKSFVSDRSQSVTPIGAHTAEIVVARVSPPKSGKTDDSSADEPTDGDRKPNNLVQSDDPRIVALARQAAGGEWGGWHEAVAMQNFVKTFITGRNYSNAFSTALDVASSRNGACTQHAVLLAALCRARGMPCRVAIGLVYTQSTPGFAFHMWNEVWITDRWMPLDAIRGGWSVAPDRIKLAVSNLAGADALSCFLPVAQVIGQARIEILDVK